MGAGTVANQQPRGPDLLGTPTAQRCAGDSVLASGWGQSDRRVGLGGVIGVSWRAGTGQIVGNAWAYQWVARPSRTLPPGVLYGTCSMASTAQDDEGTVRGRAGGAEGPTAQHEAAGSRLSVAEARNLGTSSVLHEGRWLTPGGVPWPAPSARRRGQVTSHVLRIPGEELLRRRG